MRSMDCTDIKALLSGLVDDEVDADTRFEAERHLGQCRTCRQLIDEAEALDELVRADVKMLEPNALPGDFEDAVLRRTIYTVHSRPYSHQWTTWTGWVAAAACLALAITIWVADRRAGLNTGRVVQQADPVVFEPGVRLRSLANQDPIAAADLVVSNDTSEEWWDNEMYATPWERGPSLLREDAETLYMAAVLLRMFEEGAWPGEDLAMIQQAIRYDEVLPRLADTAGRLEAADRLIVTAAQAALLQIDLSDETEESALKALRGTTIEMDLAGSIDQISRRWDQRNPV